MNSLRSEIFQMHKPPYDSDYEAIANTGPVYTREVGGYYDVLKSGYPEPSDPSTSCSSSTILNAHRSFELLADSPIGRIRQRISYLIKRIESGNL